MDDIAFLRALLRDLGESVTRLENAVDQFSLRDRDGCGEAGQTAKQAGPKATARAEGIAQP